MNLLEVKSSKQTDFALVLDIEIPSDLAVVFDNRRFAVRSIQDNWREINMEYDSYPIDLSSVVLDAPAGKYGFLTVSDGKFRFQGKPGEQGTMFFYDYCGNALEFKTFKSDADIFAT